MWFKTFRRFLSMEKNIPTLKFSKMVFRDGKNVTVRLGDKWAGFLGRVRIEDTNNSEIFKEVEIVETRTLRFFNLCDNDLEYEHDPMCQDMRGLYKVLGDYYPEIDPTTVLTLLYSYLDTLGRVHTPNHYHIN